MVWLRLLATPPSWYNRVPFLGVARATPETTMHRVGGGRIGQASNGQSSPTKCQLSGGWVTPRRFCLLQVAPHLPYDCRMQEQRRVCPRLRRSTVRVAAVARHDTQMSKKNKTLCD